MTSSKNYLTAQAISPRTSKQQNPLQMLLRIQSKHRHESPLSDIPQPLAHVTGNAVLPRTKQVERDRTYEVVIYNSTLSGEAKEVLGTFRTVEEAYRTVLTSLDDIDEDGVECEEFELKIQSNGIMSLSTAGEVNGDSGSYTPQVFTRERKLNEPAPSMVYISRDERSQYACRAPDDELACVEILDVSKDKEVAKWLIRRWADLCENDLTKGIEKKCG